MSVYYNRVKPGHINMARVLRNMEHKSGGARRLSLVFPEIYTKDSYGVETSTVKLPKINIPSMLGLVQPVTTKDFQLAKEGRYIGGAARIFVPNMDTILYKAITESSSSPTNYKSTLAPSSSVSTTAFNEYFRGFDGLMDAVFYDKEADIFDSQPFIYAGTTNWSATTDNSSAFGSDWSVFTSGTNITSDGESIKFLVSGQSGNYGTFLWTPDGGAAMNLVDRVSFDIQLGDDSKTANTRPTSLDILISNKNTDDSYPYIKYSGFTASANAAGMFLRYDLPFSSGSVGSFYNQVTPINPWYVAQGVEYDPINTTANVTMAETPATGSGNGPIGSYDWTNTKNGDNLIIGFRVRGSAGITEIKIKNIKFYRSLPWSIHSVKDRKDDYVVLNCVRTDGDSMHRQEAYGEAVPEL